VSKIAFMFPGQGAQHVGMAKEFYESEPEFRRHVDECASLLRPQMDADLLKLIYPAAEESEHAARCLTQPAVTLPGLFTIEYALAQLWLSWGIEPRAMIGHSFGEYAAACVAGVFSLSDGLKLAVARGRLMQQLPEGAMTAVRLSEAELLPHLGERLSVAAVNGNSSCTVTGPVAELANLERRLTEQRVGYRRLDVPFAYHSSMIEAILPEFTAVVAGVTLKAPTLPYVSGLTGTWIRAEEATDPLYWARQMRHPAR
jgi:acyl transferase domain-containing protein